MNPFTGKPEFKEENPVINEVTGQTLAGNQSFVNPNQNFFAPQTKPVSVLSSAEGQKIAEQNKNILHKAENAVVPGFAGQFATPEEINDPELGEGATVQRNGKDFRIDPQGRLIAADETQKQTGPLKPIGNPAIDAMVNDINEIFGSIQTSLSPQQKQTAANIQNAQSEIQAATADARAAEDAGNFTLEDQLLKKLQADKASLNKMVSDFFKEVTPLRQQLFDTMTPSEKEQQLSKQLIDIRTQAKQFEIDTQRAQLSEFEGQTQGFATGRAKEIDFKASFVRQEMALKEQNLLLELGLEQQAREMEGLAIEQQLEFIQNDFELQQDIQDRLDEKEDEILEMAEAIKDTAKEDLKFILEGLEGVNPESLDERSVAQLAQLAAQSGVPLELIGEALKQQHNQFVLDNAKDPEFQFISGTKTQASGIFDKSTGRFQAIGGTPGGGQGDKIGTFSNEFGQPIEATLPPDTPKENERQSLIFFERMKDAVDIIEANRGVVMDEGLLNQALLNRNFALLQSPEQQLVAQAMRQFTEARLRKDSGAAIPPEEFTNDRRTYFPQVGEQSPVLARKGEARQNALISLRSASANAYWERFGENPALVNQALDQQDPDFQARSAEIGDEVTILGRPYIKVGEDDFEPIFGPLPENA